MWLSSFLCLGHVWALDQNQWKLLFAPFTRKRWYCWVLSGPLCSQKEWQVGTRPTLLSTTKDHPDCPERRPFSTLPQDLPGTDRRPPCLPASPFFETFFMNKHSLHCNRLNKTISFIFQCILSFRLVKRWRSNKGERSHLGVSPKVTLEFEWRDKI